MAKRILFCAAACLAACAAFAGRIAEYVGDSPLVLTLAGLKLAAAQGANATRHMPAEGLQRRLTVLGLM